MQRTELNGKGVVSMMMIDLIFSLNVDHRKVFQEITKTIGTMNHSMSTINVHLMSLQQELLTLVRKSPQGDIHMAEHAITELIDELRKNILM